MGRTRSGPVVVELSGRLGNQLFQFASGLAIARAAGADLRFTSRRVAAPDLLLPRLIGDAYVEATTRELLRAGQLAVRIPPQPVWASIVYHAARAGRRARGHTPPSASFWHDTGRFRPGVFDLDLPIHVQGHLQSERYFAAYADDVRRAIHFPRSEASLPTGTPTVAMSFRRGDYNALGWALPLAYYDDAIALVHERVGDATFVLFGDDTAFLELVAAHISSRGAVVDGLSLGSDPVEQLHLMSRCDHCVIANSSFAWWGAWIGDRDHTDAARLVVAPAEYAGPDRLPPRWTTLVTGSALL